MSIQNTKIILYCGNTMNCDCTYSKIHSSVVFDIRSRLVSLRSAVIVLRYHIFVYLERLSTVSFVISRFVPFIVRNIVKWQNNRHKNNNNENKSPAAKDDDERFRLYTVRVCYTIACTVLACLWYSVEMMTTGI